VVRSACHPSAVRPEVERAVRVLQSGGLVAFPTETVYGLGADARSPGAVARIFAAKGRPAGHPLIVHLPSIEHLDRWAREIPDEARALAARFWPGPLTLILRKQPEVIELVTGGQDTIGLRMPDHPVARELLAAFGDGVAAPSANRFGSVSPTTAAHVRAELGDSVDVILDGGPSRVGLESSILDLSGLDLSRGVPRLLRPGATTREMLEETLGRTIEVGGGSVRAPGTLASHYAPQAALHAVARGELAASAQRAISEGKRAVVLGSAAIEGVPTILLPDDPEARASRLYAALREVDEGGFEIAFVSVPESEEGIETAIADRLRRASAPR
jgi:L-threonylcarbamoyladenylate synthase